MKKYLIFISVFAFFNSSALAEVATVSDPCATITLSGPDSAPQTSYVVNAMAKNNMGRGYSTAFYVDGQLKSSNSNPTFPMFSKSFGPFEGGHTYKMVFENMDKLNYCKRSVELAVKKMDPKEMAAGICSSINKLADNAFKNNPNQHKKAFCAKTTEVVSLITSAEASTSDSDKSQYYQQAIDKLRNDIATKMDSNAGGQPGNDWITDAYSQKPIYMSVIDLVNVLENLK